MDPIRPVRQCVLCIGRQYITGASNSNDLFNWTVKQLAIQLEIKWQSVIRVQQDPRCAAGVRFDKVL